MSNADERLFTELSNDGVLHKKWCAKIAPNFFIGSKYCTCMAYSRYQKQLEALTPPRKKRKFLRRNP